MERRRESGSITKQRELVRVQEYVMHMVLLTAGASASVLMVFLMEQWRAWVFIVLNLVLLSILFTSVSSSSSKQECSSTAVEVEADRVPVKVEVKKETRQCRWPPLKTRTVIGTEDPTEARNWNLLIGKTLNNKQGSTWFTSVSSSITSENYQYVDSPDQKFNLAQQTEEVLQGPRCCLNDNLDMHISSASSR